MKILRKPIFLPVFGIVAFLGLGAGTLLADNSNEGVGGWNTEPGATGQMAWGTPSNLAGIDGSGEARFTGQATDSESKRRAFVGTLNTRGLSIAGTTIGSLTLTIKSPGGEDEVVIGLSEDVGVTLDGVVEDSIFKFPGRDRAGTLTDGAEIVVLAEQVGETHAETEGVTDWDAVWVLIKPVKPPEISSGVVVEVDGDEVTIDTPNGEKKAVTLPQHARGLAHGAVITVFRGKSGQANGVVQAEEVKNRLKKFLADAEEEVDEAEEGDEGKGDKLDKAAAKAERIASFMERLSLRQERMLAQTIDRASNRANIARLEEVRERIQARRAEDRIAIGRIRTKLDRAHPQHSHRGGSETTGEHSSDQARRSPGRRTPHLR